MPHISEVWLLVLFLACRWDTSPTVMVDKTLGQSGVDGIWLPAYNIQLSEKPSSFARSTSQPDGWPFSAIYGTTLWRWHGAVQEASYKCTGVWSLFYLLLIIYVCFGF